MYDSHFQEAKALAYEFLKERKVQNAVPGVWFEATKIFEELKNCSEAIKDLCSHSLISHYECQCGEHMPGTQNDSVGINLLEPSSPKSIQDLIADFLDGECLRVCRSCNHSGLKKIKVISTLPQVLHVIINRKRYAATRSTITPTLVIKLEQSSYHLNSYGMYEGTHHVCRLSHQGKYYHYDGYPTSQFDEISEADFTLPNDKISFLIFSKFD